MTVTWQIKSETDWEADWRQKLGDAEYERRAAIAKEKADGLSTFEEQCVLGSQFRSLACQLKQEQFDVAADWPSWKWAKLVYKVVGV